MTLNDYLASLIIGAPSKSTFQKKQNAFKTLYFFNAPEKLN